MFGIQLSDVSPKNKTSIVYITYLPMGLFNFAQPATNNNGGAQDIQLIVNSETVTVPAAEAEGMTVKQVFSRFASSLCDTDRINRYVSTGRIVDGESIVQAGTVYSGAVASESKG